ncbi:unnamed protein product [Lathyrus sativus]|nr:unnamed protein product [Lathyrus sativus]
MQTPSSSLTKTFVTHRNHLSFFHHTLFSTLPKPSSKRVIVHAQKPKPNHNNNGSLRLKGNNKKNVWSIDNELAKVGSSQKEKKGKGKEKKKMVKRNKGGSVVVTEAMMMEVETVLQTQEPVIKPAWNTFASSLNGIWKGVGAVFSPITAEMEPMDVSVKNENLYDCYILSRIETVPSLSDESTSQIKRTVNWVTLNPYGEMPQNVEGSKVAKNGSGEKITNRVLPTFESFDFEKSDVMEEDVMGWEPGLVYFEDGSYSRGPMDISAGKDDDSKYYITPTFKFEQCLVKGCHKRIRIVHTIEFVNGGSEIQIMRVALYEEEWVSPICVDDLSGDMEFDLKPFSQRKRTKPSELTGSWKVFEISATPVYAEETKIEEEGNAAPYVYLCTETLKKRNPRDSMNYFGEEERLDMQDITVLWLPGGVTCYVDINKDGVLCIGVGWYSDEGMNLVMERDYGLDGKLKDVRWKSEMKRRWSNPPNV